MHSLFQPVLSAHYVTTYVTSSALSIKRQKTLIISTLIRDIIMNGILRCHVIIAPLKVHAKSSKRKLQQ